MAWARKSTRAAKQKSTIFANDSHLHTFCICVSYAKRFFDTPVRFSMQTVLSFGLLIGCIPIMHSEPQAPAAVRIVVLDDGSARLLEACCPNTRFESLISSDEIAFEILNSRALSMRNASCLLFRSDELSVTSRLFLDRMIAHGVPAIDIVALQQKPNVRQLQMTAGGQRRSN